MIELPNDIETFAVIADFWSRWGRWIFIGLLTIILGILVWLLMRWWRRRSNKTNHSFESPYHRMLRELADISRLTASDNIDERTQVLLGASQIARGFVAHVSHLPSESFTTEEMVVALKQHAGLREREKKTILDLMRQFDGVKFAGKDWRRDEVVQMIAELRDVIVQRQKISEQQDVAPHV